MNARQFFDRVAYLRFLQKEYFATRNHDVLIRAKSVEKEIDDEIARVQSILAPSNPPTQQPPLFL